MSSENCAQAQAIAIPGRRKIAIMEWIGMGLFLLLAIVLVVKPTMLTGVFDAMVKRVKPIAIDVFINGVVGVSIIISVIMARLLERLGFTDGLMRIFVPIMGLLKINPTVIAPAIYNIFGDINASGFVAGPCLRESGATKDEQKIAVAALVNTHQSESVLVFGIMAMAIAKVPVWLVLLLTDLVPLVLVPLILKWTIYRDTKPTRLEEIPRFTPDTPILNTLFDGAIQGTKLLFLLIIPAVAVVYALIGGLEYFGLWTPIETAMGTLMGYLFMETETGLMSVLASPTAAMAMLREIAATVPPSVVVGTYVLAASGLPLSLIFGQIPAVWTPICDLNERESIGAACVGMVLRVITAVAVASLIKLIVG